MESEGKGNGWREGRKGTGGVDKKMDVMRLMVMAS